MREHVIENILSNSPAAKMGFSLHLNILQARQYPADYRNQTYYEPKHQNH